MSVEGHAGKKYGLIITKRDGPSAKPSVPASSVFEKPKRPPPGGAFHDSDSDLERDSGDEAPPSRLQQITTSKKLAASDYLRLKASSETQKEIDKALAEDPNAFAYDEVYDDVSHSSTMQRAQAFNKTVERKPKYIEGLLVSAAQRKRENERRTERQIQKEREAEGEQFDDKEAFVTGAYREKLKQMKEDEERERAIEAAEAKMDVTKQGDLSMFYRNILEQQTTRPVVPKKDEKEDEEKIAPIREGSKRDDSKRNHVNDRRRSRSRSRDRHRGRRSRSRSRFRDRNRHRRRSPSSSAESRSSRSRSPPKTKGKSPPSPATKKQSTEKAPVNTKIFEKRNADEGTLLSAKERYLQRKMQRNLPLGDE